jgi:hypothetical protein
VNNNSLGININVENRRNISTFIKKQEKNTKIDLENVLDEIFIQLNLMKKGK